MTGIEQEPRGTAQRDRQNQPSSRRTSANRRNAKKSTGPRSERGKAIASRNSRTHGLLSSCIVVDWADFENPKNFRRLREALLSDVQPEGALEELYVEKIAVGFWRLQRMWAFERHRIVRALGDEGTKEFVERQYAKRDRSERDYLKASSLVHHCEATVRTLGATIYSLVRGLLGEASLDESVSAAIQQLAHAPDSARLLEILSDDGDRAAGVHKEEAQTGAYAGLREDLISILYSCSQDGVTEDELRAHLECARDLIHTMLKIDEEMLGHYKELLELAERHLERVRREAEEADETEFLRGYLAPPLEGLDVYLRYETSLERRLQKDIETAYRLQTIRRASRQKLLGPGAVSP